MSKKTIIITDCFGITLCLILFIAGTIFNVSTYANAFNLDSNHMDLYVLFRVITYSFVFILLMINTIFLFQKKRNLVILLIIFLIIFILVLLTTLIIIENNYNSGECTSIYLELEKENKAFDLISFNSFNDRYCELTKLFNTKSLRFEQSDNYYSYMIDYIESDSKAIIYQYLFHYNCSNKLKTFHKIEYKDDKIVYYISQNDMIGDMKLNRYYYLLISGNTVCAVDYITKNQKGQEITGDEILNTSFRLLDLLQNNL